MNIMQSYKFSHMKVWLTLLALVLTSSQVWSADALLDVTLEKQEIGTQEKPVLYFAIEVDKTRDLHVAVKDKKDWRQLKSTMVRIKKSGQYHLTVDVEDLVPGNYRIDSYLTPRGKNWNDRVGETIFSDLTVVDVAETKKPSIFSATDKVLNLDWPKQISNNDNIDLKVSFTISQPRDLQLKLLSEDSGEELGVITMPLNNADDVIVPFSDMLDNFPAGRYKWESYISAREGEEALSETLEKSFNIGQSK